MLSTQILVGAGNQLHALVSLSQAKLPSVHTVGIHRPRYTGENIHFTADNRCSATPIIYEHLQQDLSALYEGTAAHIKKA